MKTDPYLIGHWTYKGYDVFESVHPKLKGKYEITKDGTFIDRAYTLKKAEKRINERIKEVFE